jgi:hypothetical protein
MMQPNMKLKPNRISNIQVSDTRILKRITDAGHINELENAKMAQLS